MPPPIKNSIYPLALLIFLPFGIAHAQSKFTLQDFKRNYIGECVKAAINNNNEAKASVDICTCTLDVLASGLTLKDFIAVDEAAKGKNSPGEIPAVRALVPQLQRCR